MAIQNDDWDIRKSWLRTLFGGNGDFYIFTYQQDSAGQISGHALRVTTSGSRYPDAVMAAVANLHRVLEKYNLNSTTLNKEIEFKRNSADDAPDTDWGKEALALLKDMAEYLDDEHAQGAKSAIAVNTISTGSIFHKQMMDILSGNAPGWPANSQPK